MVKVHDDGWWLVRIGAWGWPTMVGDERWLVVIVGDGG